ncbi:MAG: hypothetical protein US89_C0004G0034 [Candidatus Peregrinibacteria bacterium GW2011_GWF2_38_29]|nr:MAG: hypothetical protein US89_C0004G0034 [Candidatus Peregrinibacteria bacterium GW2011_GWF2_38_29]HBB02971.1 hypothetical protein [Candidatus Peregrinibacteria bacterium]
MPSQEQEQTKITVILPTNAYFTAGIRDFTLNLIKNTAHFGEKWAYRFQLIVDELCNNAIEHGTKAGEDIKITFIYSHEFIEISVEDNGNGKNKTSAKEMEKLVEERKNPAYVNAGIRGRGLSKIVVNWTDELKFEDMPKGGLKVTAKKLLNTPKSEDINAPMESTNHIILK